MKISSFRPLMFSSGKGHFYSQPFDTISEKEAELLRALPANITQLTLPASVEEAKSVLSRWKGDGTLQRTEAETILAVEQRFSHGGREMVRLGIICLVDVFPVAGDIKPHERTFPGPMKGRYRLMKAIGCIPEPIFLITPAEGLTRAIGTAISSSEQLLRFEDPAGVENSVFAVTDEAAIATIREAAARSDAIVADGHHRLAAVREIAEEASAAGDWRWNRILAYVTEADPNGLLIAGIHRIVRNPPGRSVSAADLAATFDIGPPGGAPDTSALAIYDGAMHTLSLRDGGPVGGSEAPGIVLNELLAGRLGFTSDEIEKSVRYTHDPAEAVAAVDSGAAPFALLMPEWRVASFTELVSRGELLPQKSTFFFPKVPSGIALHEP